MNIVGVPIKRPTSKGMLIVGSVFLICILINLGMHSFAGTEVSKEGFIMTLAAFLAGSLTNACGVSIVDQGWRAMVIIFGLGTAIWAVLSFVLF
jgi:hypothetical protein